MKFFSCIQVEQIHRIFKLCGTPSEEYWKKFKLSKKFRIPQFKPSLIETFRELPESSLGLLSTLLALEPAYRGCASWALQNVVSNIWNIYPPIQSSFEERTKNDVSLITWTFLDETLAYIPIRF